MHVGVQEIVDGMRLVIPTLEFTADCFSEVKHISTEVLELVRLSATCKHSLQSL